MKRLLLIALLLPVMALSQQRLPWTRVATATPAAPTYTTVRDTVDADNEDAYSFNTDENLNDGSGISWGPGYEFETTREQLGLLFELNIPQGSIVDTVRLYIPTSNTENFSSADEVLFYCYDVDNADVFNGSHTHALLSHHATTTGYAWNFEITANQFNMFSFDDLATIVNQIVNRAGWVSGNRLGIVLVYADDSEKYHSLVDVSSGAGLQYYARIEVVYH